MIHNGSITNGNEYEPYSLAALEGDTDSPDESERDERAALEEQDDTPSKPLEIEELPVTDPDYLPF